jgi:hypothetical protein
MSLCTAHVRLWPKADTGDHNLINAWMPLTLDFGDIDTHIQSMPSIAKKRAERLFRWKQEGVQAASPI